jgi:hypothetical protein
MQGWPAESFVEVRGSSLPFFWTERYQPLFIFWEFAFGVDLNFKELMGHRPASMSAFE